MVFTREALQALGLTEAQIEGVLALYGQAAEAARSTSGPDGDASVRLNDAEYWQRLYEEVSRALDACQSEEQNRERQAKAEAAFRALLTEERIDPRRHDVILRATRPEDLVLNEAGELANIEALRDMIRALWSDFVVTDIRRGASVPSPIVGAARLSRSDILSIRDAQERQRAIAENHELFGF